MEPSNVTDAVSSALVPSRVGATTVGVDEVELREELEVVAQQALQARNEGLGLAEATRDPRFDALRHFHQDLRDALFLEIPKELESWVDGLQQPAGSQSTAALGQALTAVAHPADDDDVEDPLASAQQRALAELLVFEAIRLRLLVAAWQSESFEQLGGEESDVDDIAWEEVEAILSDPAVLLPEVRPLQVMFASASISLARDAAERADALGHVGGDLREELGMRARLRAALRELRLPESVLLENALSGLLGNDRLGLVELQEHRPVALEGMSRQAMDQRVSRGRRALARAESAWPRRRRPALFDLLRTP
ncbi:MAG: hypothetical protein ACE37F_18305 [Nannocystaceae bacterium]|nr:hypothetical protein [bacterium]